jgi:broad specificity phosphatase PhoE
VGTKPPFSSVVGLQRRIVLFVFESTKICRDKITDPIALQNFADACGTTPMAARVTIRRLEKKSLLRRAGFKNGRSGWTRYELPKDLFQELLQLEAQSKLGTKWEQTGNKVGSELGTEVGTSSPSSSSLYLESKNLKTTTTGEAELFLSTEVRLAPDWSRIDFSALEDIGFGRAHVVQLAKARLLTAEEVQDSIRFFAFDLARNKKRDEITKDPLSYLMGILRNGPYNAPSNYESPEQAARRAYVESKRRLEEKRLADEIEIRDLEFADWRRGLSTDEIKKLVPEHALGLTVGKEAILREHFNDEIWPSKRANVPGLLEGLRAQVEQEIQNSLSEAT